MYIKKLSPKLIHSRYGLVLLVCLICFVLGRYSSPSKLEIKEVEKLVQVVKEINNKEESGTINEKEIRKADGTIEITREKVYSTKEQSQKDVVTSKETIKHTKSETLPNHQVSVVYDVHSQHVNKTDFTLIYQHRIFSSLYLGGFVKPESNPSYGVIISLGF